MVGSAELDPFVSRASWAALVTSSLARMALPLLAVLEGVGTQALRKAVEPWRAPNMVGFGRVYCPCA
jgi:hypothetical protein